LRTYGRITNPDGSKTWQMVQTDANGNNDAVWITTLMQCLLLNLKESPFFTNYGIPAQASVLTQMFPDYYVNQLQSQFAQYFASLIIAKIPNLTTPSYGISIITNSGATISATIPV